MIRKLLIVPYFGSPPPFFPQWLRSVTTLRRYGYDLLLDTDEAAFRARAKVMLGVDCPPMAGTSKAGDFRPAFGLLYQDELDGYEFWGHTDTDCVYGRVGEWLTDDFLNRLDVHANGDDYLCGPWTLFRNAPVVNTLFTREPRWRQIMADPTANGFDEVAFTPVVEDAHVRGEIRLRYTYWHTRDLNDHSTLHFDGDRLMEGDDEVFYAHLRRTKKWPDGCVVAL